MRFSGAVTVTAAMIAMLLAGSIEPRADARLAPPAASLVGNGGLGVVVRVRMLLPQKCIVIDGEEFCLVKKRAGTPTDQAPGNPAPQGGNAAPQGGNAAPQPDGGTANTGLEPGEHACPPGYVVLDKPNKYRSFCEPKEGFPTTTPAAGPTTFNCEADVSPANIGHASYAMQAATEAEARGKFDQHLNDSKFVATSPVTCTSR